MAEKSNGARSPQKGPPKHRAARRPRRPKWVKHLAIAWGHVSFGWRVFFSACVILGTLFTIFYAWIWLGPAVDVMPDAPMAIGKPFNSPFAVKNESVLPIYSVQAYFQNCFFQIGGLSLRVGGGIRDDQAPVPEIASGKQIDIMPPSNTVGGAGATAIDSANVTIMVSYKAFPWLYMTTQSFHYIANKGTDGTLHWYPMSPDQYQLPAMQPPPVNK